MGLLTALAGAGRGRRRSRSPSRWPERRALAAELGAVGVEPDPEAAAAALGARPTVGHARHRRRAARGSSRSPSPTAARVIQLFAPVAARASAARSTSTTLFFRELEIQASYSAGPRDTRAALDLIASGAIPADGSSPTASRSSDTEEALAAARSREGIKVIVTSAREGGGPARAGRPADRGRRRARAGAAARSCSRSARR